jgi:dolichyl-phosphate beta-glucosyltransferase
MTVVSAPRPHLSIVIPAFNEAQRIAASLEVVTAFLARQPYQADVLVVQDGSTDGTEAVVRRVLGGRVTVSLWAIPENRGKGFSVRSGMLAARGEHLLFSDADLSTPIEETTNLLAALAEGHQLAIGSRAMPNSDVRRRQPWWRERMGKVFNLCVRAVGISPFRDTQCGFKCFARSAAREIFTRQRLDGFGFDVEVLLIATRLGYSIREVPVVWIDDPHSRVHPLRDSARMLVDLARIRRFDRRGCYAGHLNARSTRPASTLPDGR